MITYRFSTTGMVVSLKTDLRFPIHGQQGHGDRIIHLDVGPTAWLQNNGGH